MANKIFLGILTLAWLTVAATFTIRGWDYYRMPLHERAYAESHDVYKPSGSVGLALGAVGSVMMVSGVALYSTRRRFRRLRGLGKLRNWLSMHIFLCTLGPFLILLHSSFKVGGLVSISFWSMVVVVLSGLVGRYVYVRIPKTLQGQFRSLRNLEVEKEEVMGAIRRLGSVNVDALAALFPVREQHATPGIFRAVALAFQYDLHRRQRRTWIARNLMGLGSDPTVRRQLESLIESYGRLEQQMLILTPFEKVFRYWHAFHLPLAVVMFSIMCLHVAVAIAFGYVWEF